jgi:ribosomal protein L11 methyltransferase
MSAGQQPMRWLELSVETDVEAVEPVSEILGRVAAGTAVQPTRLLHEAGDELSARPDPSAPYVVTAHVAAGPGSEIAIEDTERALWHLQAFGLRPVILDPGMAFGTGLHPTTRGCLALLQGLAPMPSRVLDVGIGSGILAIAALRLGATSVHGVDTDPLAVDAARTNAERNGLGDRVTADAGTLPAAPVERFPLVLANLVAAILVDLAPRLAAHLAPGGVLVASGIIAPRADEVIGAMEGVGLAVQARRDDDEWVSLRLEPAP